MPSLDEHKRQADANKKFFCEISREFNSQYFDWKITTLFYEIVHCAEQLAAKHGIHNNSHIEREGFLGQFLENSHLGLYRQLKNASRRSRYEVKDLSQASRAYCMGIFQNTYLPLRQAFDNKYNIK